MSIKDHCDTGQHHQSHHIDTGQHRNTPGKVPTQRPHPHPGRVAKAEDGQKYSTSYTSPEPQMHSYPGGVRPQGYIGMQAGPEQTENCPAEVFTDMISTQHGGSKGNIPGKN